MAYLYIRNVTQPRAKEATTKQTDTTETCRQRKGEFEQFLNSPYVAKISLCIFFTCKGPKKMHLSCSGLSSFSWWPKSDGGEAQTRKERSLNIHTSKLSHFQTFTLSNFHMFNISHSQTFTLSFFITYKLEKGAVDTFKEEIIKTDNFNLNKVI